MEFLCKKNYADFVKACKNATTYIYSAERYVELLKVKVFLEQATKAQRWSWGIALLFL
jgi:hypothetical protein